MNAALSNPFMVGKKKPIVVGHRGVPARHQENTLAGFKRAVQLGVPAIELDVQLTKDRRAVVLHDAHLRRLTGSPRNVWDLTWDQLRKLRIRRDLPMGVDVHGRPIIAKYDREEQIPLLAEVLAEVASKVAINVELKLNVFGWWQTEVARVVAADVRAAGAEDSVILTSFDPRKLRAALAAYPRLATGFCFNDTMLDFAAPLLERVPHLRN
jgi:glycerophosphoryl diester phosphodiesterase